MPTWIYIIFFIKKYLMFFNFSSFKTYIASEILILNIENNVLHSKKFNELKNKLMLKNSYY